VTFELDSIKHAKLNDEKPILQQTDLLSHCQVQDLPFLRAKKVMLPKINELTGKRLNERLFLCGLALVIVKEG
jgi:hypothetical protein